VAASLSSDDRARVASGVAGARPPKVVFLFPGGGSQEVGMGRELYESEPVYRESLDRAAALFEAALSVDIRQLVFASVAEREAAERALLRPSLNLAAVFSTEYALARLLIALGVTPAAVTGHSLGEYAAACIAGILSLEDCVALLVERARIYEEMPEDAGSLIVATSEAALLPRLGDDLSLAAVNAEDSCVVSGRGEALERLFAELTREGISAKRLAIAGAAHSALVEPSLGRMTARAASMRLASPRIPMVSNVTGDWLDEDEARDPSYWARHLRSTVRFADGIGKLLADPDHVFVEVGPGRTLSTLTWRHVGPGSKRLCVTSLASRGSDRTDLEAFLFALGELWCAGVAIDGEAYWREERRRRVPLPTYPFERKLHVAGASQVQPALFLAVPTSHDAPSEDDGPLSRSSRAMRALPADPIERALAEIFGEVLGVGGVRAEDNFFDLGGNSLIAFRLRTKIEDRLRVSLPVHALVESPTLGGLASRVRRMAPAPIAAAQSGADVGLPEGARTSDDEAGPRPGPLAVTLAKGDPGARPLFLIQPIGGTVYTYLPLARTFGGTRTVIGIRASGMEPGEPILGTVEAMASRYLEEVQAIQPEGPYLIGGHSAGGQIAFEMVRQLLERGEQVALLAMLDVPSPVSMKRAPVESVDDVLGVIARSRASTAEGYQNFTAALQERSPFSAIVLAIWKAIAAYEPRAIQVDTLYLRARQSRDPEEPGERYWMDLVEGAFSRIDVDADHFAMMEAPHADAVGRILRRALSTLDEPPISGETGPVHGQGPALATVG
jgi:thioesterase domain-containing protein/malonyl CoA-acyl carrier protein transacylase/acyl carrier protein